MLLENKKCLITGATGGIGRAICDTFLKNGAEFIVAITGNIFTMPGLPESPSAERIGLDDYENIVGLF